MRLTSLQYTYFTASALGVKVPQALKRTLTSLQIAQFVFGASYAAAHLFVAYDIPIQVPYQVVSSVERAVSSASSAASAVTSTVSDFVETPTVTATASIGSLMKKLLLRAAGEEGVAERVAMSKPDASAYVPSAPQIERKMDKIWERRFETHYRSEWSRVNCIDTTGEAFAIFLNLMYLAPLTWLFGRFFVRAYTARGKGRKLSSPSAAAQVAKDVAREAKHNTEDTFEKGGKKAEDELAHRASQGAEKGEEVYDQLRKDVKSMKDGTWQRRVSERVQSYEGKIMTAAEKAKEKAKSLASGEGSESPSRGGSNDKTNETAIDDSAEPDSAEPSSKEGATQEPESEDNAGEDKENQAPASSSQPNQSESKAADDKPSGEGKEEAFKDQEKTSREQEEGNSKPKAEEEPASQPQTPSKKNKKKGGKGSGSPAKSNNRPADENSSRPSSSQQQQSDNSKKATEDPAPSSLPAEEQDKVIAESTPTRPAPQEDDSDAMGRSGIDVESSDAQSSQAGNGQEGDGYAESKMAET